MTVAHAIAGAINDNQATNTSTPQFTLSPVNLQVGDVVVAVLGSNTGAATITPPAGWSTLFPMIYTQSNHGTGAWGKVITEGDLGTQAIFTLSTGGRAHGVWQAVRGAEGLPTVMSRVTDTTGGTNVQAPDVTTDSADNLVVSMGLLRSGTATAAFAVNPGGGYTERAEGNTAFTTVPNFVATTATRDTLSGASGSVITGSLLSVVGPTDVTGHAYTFAFEPAAVATPPNSAFSASPTTGQAPLTVQFLNQSTGTDDSWLWDFGDTQTSTLENPAHTYETPGTYTVTLTSSGPGGVDVSPATTTITVSPPPVPVSSFLIDPQSGEAPLTVQFTDTSSNLPTGWSWDFGDGEVSNDRSPIHTYQNPGSYTVTLVASNSAGPDATPATGTVTVNAPAGRKMLKLRGGVWVQGEVLRARDGTWQ